VAGSRKVRGRARRTGSRLVSSVAVCSMNRAERRSFSRGRGASLFCFALSYGLAARPMSLDPRFVSPDAVSLLQFFRHHCMVHDYFHFLCLAPFNSIFVFFNAFYESRNQRPVPVRQFRECHPDVVLCKPLILGRAARNDFSHKAYRITCAD
jgi:hypothetical protein